MTDPTPRPCTLEYYRAEDGGSMLVANDGERELTLVLASPDDGTVKWVITDADGDGNMSSGIEPTAAVMDELIEYLLTQQARRRHG